MSMEDLIKRGADQVGSLAREMTNFATSGFQVVTDDQYEDRLKICSACEFFDSSMKRCGKCGCFMVAKAKIAVSGCPISKWHPVASKDGSERG